MNPVSKEYFHTLEMLREELYSFKTQQGELKFQISKLFEENRRLTNELKENMILREQHLSESGFSDLEQKLRAAIDSKNAAIEMWQEALKQLEKQEEQLIGRRNLVECERNESGKMMEQVKEEYVKGLNILSTEVTAYRNDLLNATKELQQKTEELEKCQNDLDSLRSDLSSCQKVISDISSEKAELEAKVVSLQNVLSESEKFLSATKEEMAVIKTENFDLSSIVTDLKEQNKKLKIEIEVCEKDMKESFFTAQEAVQRKKEMAYRERQYLKEIEHLKESIDIETEKVAFKFKSEMKEIQKQSAEKVQQLMQEIQTLHQENSDKQSLFEKAVRDKQALESKLELLYSEYSTSHPSSSGVFDDLCKRLTMAEKDRDEFEFKVRSLETELQEVKSSKEQEVQDMLSEQNRLKDRLHKLSTDFNQSLADRIKFSDDLTKLRKKCSELEKEVKCSRTRHANEMSLLREESQQKQQSLTEQLQANEEHYKRMCGELQKMLEAEFKISNRWKAETEDLVTKSEAKIIELCQTITQLRNQNRELVNIFQHTNYVPNLSSHDVNRLSSLNYNIENPTD